MKSNYGNIYVISWDWKESPNWNTIAEVIHEILQINNGLRFIDINTKSDSYCVVIGTHDLTELQAQECYEKHQNGE